MTGALEIIRADRARWQRQAAAELARSWTVPGAPAIAWTVGPAGCVLAGRVTPGPGRAGPGGVRAWRAALALEEYREHRLAAGRLAARGGPPHLVRSG